MTRLEIWFQKSTGAAMVLVNCWVGEFGGEILEEFKPEGKEN